MNAKIDLEKFICSYVKWSNIQDALKDQGLKCWNGEIVEIESEDERIKKEILELVSISGNGNQFEEIKGWLEEQGEKPQVDGFDAELNALLKKYDHLSKKELQEPLEFYLGVVRDDLDVVREEKKPMWTEEDEAHLHSITTHLEQWIERHPNTCGADIQGENLAWLKSLKQRIEQ